MTDRPDWMMVFIFVIFVVVVSIVFATADLRGDIDHIQDQLATIEAIQREDR